MFQESTTPTSENHYIQLDGWQYPIVSLSLRQMAPPHGRWVLSINIVGIADQPVENLPPDLIGIYASAMGLVPDKIAELERVVAGRNSEIRKANTAQFELNKKES